MNDRFKFRCYWEDGLKEMYYYDTYCMPKLVKGEEKTAHIMQCTGLRDKNGKLIYEGDIVKNHGWWDASGPAGYEKDTCVVEFDKSVCGFTPMCNYDCDCWVYHKAEDLEVIGNIYENEDLLKCENK